MHSILVRFDIPVAEDHELDVRASPREVARGLAIKSDVERFKSGDEDDAPRVPRRVEPGAVVAEGASERFSLGLGSSRGSGDRASSASRNGELSLGCDALGGYSVALELCPVRVSLEGEPHRLVTLLGSLEKSTGNRGLLDAECLERRLVDIGELTRDHVTVIVAGCNLDCQAGECGGVRPVEFGGQMKFLLLQALHLLLERFDDLFGSIWGDGLRDRNSLSFQLFAQEELRFALSLSLWRFTQSAEGRDGALIFPR